MPTPDERKTEAIERIAREVLDIDTLEPRGHDRLDFYDMSVWRIRQAMDLAYEAGRAAGRQ